MRRITRWTTVIGMLAMSAAAAADLPATKATAPSATVDAPTAEERAVIDAVQKKYAGVSSMKASFVQTTRSEIFGAEEQAGEVVLERPSKMRWDFPVAGKQFVTDGQTMWVYTQADNQVLQFDDVGAQADTAQELLVSLDRIDQLFNVDVQPPTEGRHTLDLFPKSAGQFKKVRLVLGTDLLVSNVTITDTYDGVTELAFSNVKLNVDVPQATFEFAVPAGAEVISAGGM